MTLDAEHGTGTGPEPSDADPDRSPPRAVDAPGDDADTAPDGADHVELNLRRRGGASAGLLGMAMLAVGEILEPDKTTVEIVQTDDEPLDDLPFSIDFGDLPPLD